MNTIIKALRDGETVTTFGYTYRSGQGKFFTHYQINKGEKYICWQRFESLDRRNWVKQNDILRLRDVLNCIEKNKLYNQKT